MQAIRVKHSWDHNGNSRYTARCNAGNVSRYHKANLSHADDVRAIARELIEKLGWQDHGVWSVGEFDNGLYFVTCAARKDDGTHVFEV